jgi:hypothetical protein
MKRLLAPLTVVLGMMLMTEVATAQVVLPWRDVPELSDGIKARARHKVPVVLPPGWPNLDDQNPAHRCRPYITGPGRGEAPARKHGPVVQGIVGVFHLDCIGLPAENIHMVVVIGRDTSIVSKFIERNPPGAYWKYDGLSLAMRGPYDVVPGRYQVGGYATWTQGDVDYISEWLTSPARYFSS